MIKNFTSTFIYLNSCLRPGPSLRQPFVGLVFVAALAIFSAEIIPVDLHWLLVLLLIAFPFLICRPVTVFVLMTVAGTFFTLHQWNHWQNPGRQLLIGLGSAPQTVRAGGIVMDEPMINEGAHGVTQSRLKVQLEWIKLSDPVVEGKMGTSGTSFLPIAGGDAGSSVLDGPCSPTVLVKWVGVVPAYGDRVEFIGNINPIPSPRNPGQMDFASYFQRLGIYSEIQVRYAGDGRIISHGHGNYWIVWAGASRRWMQLKLALDLQDTPESAGLIQSLVLGLKDQTPEETRECFRRTGTAHLFVVNGLHIGMLALIAQFLLRPFGINRRCSVFLVIPLLAFYTLATGLHPGSIRATLMAAVLLFGCFFDRQPVSLNTLAAAALVILAWDTEQLFMPGFQFSFGVVLTIILLAGRFKRLLTGLGRPDSFLPRIFWSPLQEAWYFCCQYGAGWFGLSLAAWIGSLPFTLHYFHLFSPGAVVANLVMVPLAFVVLSQGILALIAAIGSVSLTVLFNNANWAVVQLLLLAVRFFAQIPGESIFIGPPSLDSVECEMTVFDFNAGDSVYLRSNHRAWLIDAGSSTAYENTVRPFLQMRGVNRLAGLILAGGGSGSVGGAIPVLFDLKPDEVIDSAVRDQSPQHTTFFTTLAKLGLGKGIYEPGDVFTISRKATARVLYPPAGIKVRVLDDKAMVIQIKTGEFRVLLMVNAGFLTERWLLEHEPDLKSNILIKGRHPSDLSGTSDFLDAVQPQVVIAASSGFTMHSGVSEAWIREVSARGIVIFPQDSCGAVQIKFYKNLYSVEAFLGNQIFRRKSR